MDERELSKMIQRLTRSYILSPEKARSLWSRILSQLTHDKITRS